MASWIGVTGRENWDVIKGEGVWGISRSPRLKKSVDSLKIGDRIFIYIKQERKDHNTVGPLIGGVFEVISEPFKSDTRIFALSSRSFR